MPSVFLDTNILIYAAIGTARPNPETVEAGNGRS